MTRLAFTPGEGGGKPAPLPPSYMDAVEDYEIQQEQRLGISDPPQDPPQPRPEPEPDVTSVTPMVNIISSNPPPSTQQTAAKPRPATTRPGPVLVPPDILDINPDAVGSLEQQIAALSSGQPIGGSAQPIEQAPAQMASGYDTTPLTQLQEEQVDHLLSVETDTMAREVLLGLKREGMPSDTYISDFMSQYAEWGWDDLSSALAMQVLEIVRDSDWDEWLGHADSAPVETTAQDLGNDWIEGLVILDAKAGDTLLDVTGVELADGSQFVGLQDYEVESLRELGLELIFVHNHTKEVGASDEDLDSAFRAGAELLIVITPSGREQVYIRGRDRMVLVRDEQASYDVGSSTLDETIELAMKSAKQARAYLDDAPELIFRQDDPGIQIEVTGFVQFDASDAAVVLDEGINRFRSYEESLFNVVGKSRLNPYVVLVEDDNGEEFWIDLEEYDDTTYDIIGAENLAGIPYADESAANTVNPYIRTAMGVADLLPIAQEDIAEQGVIAFGATGNRAWENTGGFHPGFDIFAEAGTEVKAITSGEVVGIFVPANVNYDHVYGTAVGSYVAKGETPGKIYDPQTVSVPARQWFADNWLVERDQRAYVIVRSGNAYVLYGHLDPDSIQVGTHVVAGQPIGAVGDDPHHDNDHLHFEVKTHGQSRIPLDENEEYVARSIDHRPQFFLNPLYLYDEESRERIIVEYGLDPLADQLLAIQGTKPIDHSGRGVGFYWRDRTGILTANGDN